MKKEDINIEMANMIGKTYFKVATWHNQDYDNDKQKQDALKHTCFEIIQQILEDTFSQLEGAKTGSKTIKNDSKKDESIRENIIPTNGEIKINEEAFKNALTNNVR